MRLAIFRLFLVLVTIVNVAVATIAAPVVFALQIVAGAWRGFRGASYIMRQWFGAIFKKFPEGWKKYDQ